MPRTPATLDSLFDRTWRPGRPLRPRLSPFRRYGMLCLLCFLLSVIGAYAILTDSTRVRKMCESYLSRLTGGHVEVRGAVLSIFEGLRLEGVSVRVDNSGAADSTLFDVQTVLLKYNPESILSGKLEATEIVAIDPRVRLCENVDLRVERWNYERLQFHPPTSQPRGAQPMILPQIKMRNGQVLYSQLRNGTLTAQGTMALDGSVLPGERLGTCLFRLQSRVENGAMGPVITGQAIPSTGESWVRLDNFTVGPSIKAVVPDMVRRFMEDHELVGRVDADLHVKPNPKGGIPDFRVDMLLKRVDLSGKPDEWLSRAERRQVATLRGAFDLMRLTGMNETPRVEAEEPAPTREPAEEDVPPSVHRGLVDLLDSTVIPTPVRMKAVDGEFVFTPDQIEIKSLTGQLEHNNFRIEGHVDGYNADAPAVLSVVCEDLGIPHSPRYANALPRVVRIIYEILHPEGSGRLWVKVDRHDLGKRPIVSGELDVGQGSIQVDPFPYPLRNLKGKVAFGPNPNGIDQLQLINLIANGVKDGPNENNAIAINGLISPIDGDAQMDFNVKGEHILSERAIRDAIPKEAREALNALDPSGKGDFPTFKANIVANIHRAEGPYKPFKITLTMDLEDGAGTFEGFPYPIEHMTGRLVIGEDYVNLVKCIARKGDASVMLDGRLTFGHGQPLTPTLTLQARNIPIDQTLLKAINPEQREWLEKLGVSGKLDVDGTIFLKEHSSEVGVVMDIKVHDGTMWPRDSTFAVSNLHGNLHLADGLITFNNFAGTRGLAKLAANGKVTWAGHAPAFSISATANNLLLESALHNLLPKDAQDAWDSVHPEGTVNVALQLGDDAKPRSTTDPVASANLPTTAPTEFPYRVLITPVKLGVIVKELPYKLTDLGGSIQITPRGTELRDVTAKHNAARLFFAGTGTNVGKSSWSLKMTGRDVPVDDELRKALPASCTQLMESMKLRGKLAFDFTRLDYRPGETRPDGKAGDADLDLAGTLGFTDASMEVGIPASELDGSLQFEAGVRNGKLGALKGLLVGKTLKLAKRPAKDLSMELFKPEDQDAMRLTKIRGELAGGEIAGKVALAFPDDAASHFVVDLLLRDADVTQLTGEKDIHGQITASLALEGAWNDASTRRGRGDVAVSGRDMYHIPLMLGLMQITNLSLPISSPFSEATSRYSVDGQKITFEQIELRASNMLMQGSGSMNFETKKVKLTFVTENPNWPKLPLVNDLIEGAKHELLQIQVNGTIEEPKVSAGVMSTFQTTIDEVFRGGKGK